MDAFLESIILRLVMIGVGLLLAIIGFAGMLIRGRLGGWCEWFGFGGAGLALVASLWVAAK